MRRSICAVLLLACVAALPAGAQASTLQLSATTGSREVDLTWAPQRGPVVIRRDGARLAKVNAPKNSYADRTVQPGRSYRYTIESASGTTAATDVALPAYL